MTPKDISPITCAVFYPTFISMTRHEFVRQEVLENHDLVVVTSNSWLEEVSLESIKSKNTVITYFIHIVACTRPCIVFIYGVMTCGFSAMKTEIVVIFITILPAGYTCAKMLV